jgi:hypothetical protein
VELPVRRDQPGLRGEVQAGQEPQHELVGVLAERDAGAGLVEEKPEAVTHALGLRERAFPFLVHMPGSVLERLDLAVQCDIRPGLMRVPGQQQPVGDPELGVVPSKVVHSSLRTAHRSGKIGVNRVVRR